MGLLSRLFGGGMMEGHGGMGQLQPPQPSMMSQLGNLATDPMFQHNMQMAMTGESQGLPPMRPNDAFGGDYNGKPPMANNPSPGLQPPQMPPPQGGMNALQGAFGNSPGFQAQLGQMHAQQSPGFMPPQFTPPQTPVPPMTGQTNQGLRGRAGGPGGTGALFGAQPGQPNGDPLRWLRGMGG